ncbi:MAG TPA: DUF4199 domain-containing protein [Bacteroidales bacterium]|nr:DUF4199 domain-containing protein [Bacteroidales bacterium]HRZ47779.1 DUF4199 domain-containing protein [Bacteroidales bacterium]
MKKINIELKWGIFFTLMMIVWMILEKVSGLYSTHIDKHATFTNFVSIPAILMYVFALLEKRRKDYKGSMTYLQGFKTGLWMTLVITLLTPLTQYLTVVVISPEFFPNMIAYTVEKGIYTPEGAEKYFSLGNYMIQSLLFAPVMGIVTTAIVAIFTRRR